jgi:sigma-B regulation protein RsbU (phosphoserine phosphatase)
MTYVRAGHPKPLLRRAKGRRLRGARRERLALRRGQGAALLRRAWRSARSTSSPGDIVLLYTDGVIEAGPAAAQFGLERVKDALASAPADGTARAILDHVVAALDAFVGEGVMGDDVTLICLKIK